MGRTIKAICNVCKEEAKHLYTRNIDGVLNLYYACLNPECKHQFVMIQTFSHSTSINGVKVGKEKQTL